MHPVIQKVLETEAEAKRLVEKANAEAEQMILQARQRAKAIREEGKRKAHIETDNLLKSADEAATEEKARRLEVALGKTKIEIQVEPHMLDEAVRAVLRCVCSPHSRIEPPSNETVRA